MANKKDAFIRVHDRQQFMEFVSHPELVVYRSSDENDGAQFQFGYFFRLCKTVEEAQGWISRSAKQRYMGPKRHQWYSVAATLEKQRREGAL